MPKAFFMESRLKGTGKKKRPSVVLWAGTTSGLSRAGNAYDCPDAAGVLIHQYGPHIFHTNDRRVFDYLSRFTKWRRYRTNTCSYT